MAQGAYCDSASRVVHKKLYNRLKKGRQYLVKFTTPQYLNSNPELTRLLNSRQPHDSPILNKRAGPCILSSLIGVHLGRRQEYKEAQEDKMA
jgi:hypothetical protein